MATKASFIFRQTLSTLGIPIYGFVFLAKRSATAGLDNTHHRVTQLLPAQFIKWSQAFIKRITRTRIIHFNRKLAIGTDYYCPHHPFLSFNAPAVSPFLYTPPAMAVPEKVCHRVSNMVLWLQFPEMKSVDRV